MKKRNGFRIFALFASLWGFVAWLTGVIVSLAVGFGLIDGVLAIKYIPLIVTEIAGWIVVGLSLIGVLLAIIDKTFRSYSRHSNLLNII